MPVVTEVIGTEEPPMPPLAAVPKKEPKTAIEEDEDDEGEKEKKASNISPALLKLKNAADMETKAWLDAISGETAIRVRLLRKDPKSHRDPETGETVKTDGTLQVFDRTVDEEEVQRLHGGGTFQLVVQTKNTKGQWGFFGAKTFEVAGDPNIKGVHRTFAPKNEPTIVVPQKDGATEKALDRMVGFMIEDAHNSRRQPPVQMQPSGIDPATMQAMIKPLEIQIQALTAQLAAKDVEMARVRETAGKDPFRDKMLETMMDGESARITALRENHASEIRQLKEGFRQDLERERERHRDDMVRVEKAHERELSAIKAANDQSIALSTQKGDITKMVLERENNSAQKTIDRLETELSALRAKKEQSIKEKVDELHAIKELVGDGDDEESSKLEQIIGAVGGLPVVQELARRATGGQQAPAQVAQQPQKPQLVRDRTTGEVGLRKPSGEIVPVKKRPVPVTTADGQQVEIPSLDPAQVAQAVTYMEGAYRNGTDPVMFASTARPFVSEPMLGVIRTLGISEFLTKVGKISGASVLATLRGRQWAKKVAAALMGEDDQPAAPEPAAEATPQP